MNPAGSNDYGRLIRAGLVDFYARFIHPGDLVFDLGANIGERAAVFLALNARVVCVEPDPECVQALQTLYAGWPAVMIVPMGVADAPGTLAFYHNRLTVMSTFSRKFQAGYLGQQGHVWEPGVPVQVTTLDGLIQEFGVPKFCKIDVEGYEPQVLNGLSTPLPALSFEFHQETLDEVEACLNRLVQLGAYEFNFADGEAFVMALPRWVNAAELMDILKRIPDPHYRPFWGGDVYARLAKQEERHGAHNHLG